MGDLKASEAYTDVVFITPKNSTTGAIGLSPTCYSVKASDNTRTVLAVTELGDGWYTATFINDAAGTWMTEWVVFGNYTIHYPYKTFKIGGGRTEDINTAVTVIAGLHNVPTADVATNSQMRDVVGNKNDTVAGTSVVALLKQINAKTTALPTDPADASDVATLIGTRAPSATALTNVTWTDARAAAIDELLAANLPTDIATIAGYHDVTAAADSAANSQIRDVVGRKDDTVAGNSSIALLKQIEGAGFATGTDSLKILSDMLDTIRTEITYQMRPFATLNQSNPVSEQYYTALDTTANVQLVTVCAQTTGGTVSVLDVKVIVDGEAINFSLASPVSTTLYKAALYMHDAAGKLVETTDGINTDNGVLIEGRSVKVEVAVTWSVQPTPLKCWVRYRSR